MDNTIKNLIKFMNEKLEEIAEKRASEVAAFYDCTNKEEELRKIFEVLRSYFEEEQGFIPCFSKPYGRENARTILILHNRWKNKNKNYAFTTCEEEEATPAVFPKKAASIGAQLLARRRRWDTRTLRTLLFRAGEL